MKAVFLIKVMVLLMGILILAGFVLIAVKIADNPTKSKPQTQQFALGPLETVSQMTPCGQDVCILTDGGEQGHRILVISPEKMTIKGTIDLKK
ncbi:MAG: hypothetical protein LBU87_02990 [Lactobacillales bacterium]|jgi:hypothetical protein|nr:hypothetical protein [Lactobacillales bacterium]